MSKRIASGISIREAEVRRWLNGKKFKGEYLLVSTKKEVRDHPLGGEAGGSEIRSGRLIVDLYTPLMLEKQVSFRWWNPLDWRIRQVSINNIKSYLLAGDHFLVANRRQREYWIETAGSLGVKLTERDISVLPTGAGQIQNSEFRIQNSARRNVVLWFGGVYPWMEPRPLVEAFSRVCRKYPKWKLRFLGGWHPATGYKGIYRKLEEFSKQRIPKNQLEFIPWQQEKNLNKYFEDVAFAVHLVKPTLEDYYAHRVRLLTLLEARIPVITGGRDVISDLIDEIKAGMKVKVSIESLASKLSMVMSNPRILANWKLQTFTVWKLLRKREYVSVKWRKMPSDRIKNLRRI